MREQDARCLFLTRPGVLGCSRDGRGVTLSSEGQSPGTATKGPSPRFTFVNLAQSLGTVQCIAGDRVLYRHRLNHERVEVDRIEVHHNDRYPGKYTSIGPRSCSVVFWLFCPNQ